MRQIVSAVAVLALVAAASDAARAQTSFVAFESGPVRPLALSPEVGTAHPCLSSPSGDALKCR
jgi:hypothetical protein